VRIERRVLVHLDRRAQVAALQIQLGVVEADRLAEQLADHVEDRRLEGHPAIERIVVGGILDPP